MIIDIWFTVYLIILNFFGPILTILDVLSNKSQIIQNLIIRLSIYSIICMYELTLYLTLSKLI